MGSSYGPAVTVVFFCLFLVLDRHDYRVTACVHRRNTGRTSRTLLCCLSFFGDFSAARPRFVTRLAPSDSPQSRGPCPRAGPPSPRPSRSASEVARSRLRGLPHAPQSQRPIIELFFCDFSAAKPRFVARLARSDSPQSRGPCPRADPPSPRPSRSASEVARSRLRGLPHAPYVFARTPAPIYYYLLLLLGLLPYLLCLLYTSPSPRDRG